LHVWALINDILFWFGVFILTWLGYIVAFHKGVPNIGTAPALQKKAVEVLKKFSVERGNKPFTLIDLGSGDGNFTRRIAKNVPTARITGIETAPQSFAWSRFMKKVQRLDNLDYKKGDFFDQNFRDTDVVIMYQSVFLMEKLGKKLHEELKPGALIITVRYPLGDGWQPTEHHEIRSLYLHQKDLYIYRKV
jgi:trans-aconitate methyltransferase